MEQRANKHLESYHRTLNNAVQVRHPSLWMCLHHLKDQQQLAEEKLEMAARGHGQAVVIVQSDIFWMGCLLMEKEPSSLSS
ncbi:hypothetical protein AALO_G00200450 [Alosa alosa]|uniref:Uncharacterized protein n=1 Tax=Alosa alosa TaxID=278164 RepID=A0AAV6G5A0_9TELE|nr:hypothetical protein AALO_G00200450 [Alosa alosa]